MFDLPEGAPVVVVSGGGWGVGDLERRGRGRRSRSPAVRTSWCCAAATTSCSRQMERALRRHDPRVHVSGFTERMNELFAAADVLIHSTAGLTVLEALHTRLPRDLLRLGDRAHQGEQRAFERFGIARVARTATGSRGRPARRARRAASATATSCSPRCPRRHRPCWRRPGAAAGVKRGRARAATAAWCGPGLAPHAPPLCGALGIPRRLDGAPAWRSPSTTAPTRRARRPCSRRSRPRTPRHLLPRGRAGGPLPVACGEIAAAGHEIALHGYRHRNQMRVTPGWLADDLARGADAIGERHRRRAAALPAAVRDLHPGRAALVRERSTSLLWSRWGRDWRTRTNGRGDRAARDPRPERRRRGPAT